MEKFNSQEALQDSEILKSMEAAFAHSEPSDAELLALWAYNYSSDFIQQVQWPDNNRQHLQDKWNTLKRQGMGGCDLAINFFLELSRDHQKVLIDWYRTTFN